MVLSIIMEILKPPLNGINDPKCGVDGLILSSKMKRMINENQLEMLEAAKAA